MINTTALLKNYDLKVTPQRIAIIEELYKNGHMNIDDLYKKLLDRFPSVSLATIYKNINSMVEKLFLSEVKIPNAKTVYELSKNEHAHLVCSNCKAVMDIELDSSDISKQISNLNNFKVNQTDIILSGICQKCS
ncbi:MULTISPECIES: Fur family transcriptional regulator [Aliarcobacter]|jgi:Fur family peroxide stress response transcriptional regulator|uniref:Transcriptional repressor n=3 Tax=Aliarcobacter skirrowii TaxID=28200 RepID=A0A2U2C254_9BACT|nr:transcriptional repressor [Aliarcobacter skirrowii]AXX84415.1 peroxide stress transcriptional regulator PerR [Aliarcobacter skirrowii CCUG 10374]KAB0621410.1 transcriptional repressor [Aliarcobacter skirrowii CCUG 10374]MDD2508037.1 transcriptional repressor [Aliarcobacter skirrowii]MDD3496275.1 transcriptional repressor [Aliarcobacter skirrowii]MDX3960377.1 transcriptional repressor [Aliarcobacter skirrowii]